MRPGLFKIVAGLFTFCILTSLPFAFGDETSPEYLLSVSTIAGSSNLSVTNLSSGKTTPITFFSDADKGIIRSLSITDKADKIYFTRPSPLHGKVLSTIWTITPEGQGLSDIGSDPLIEYRDVAISPDGKKLAYTANSISVPEEYQLYVRNINGTDLRQLSLFPVKICSYPTFISQDTILFHSKTDALEDYYTIQTNGLNLVNLTNNTSLTPFFPRLGRPMLDQSRQKIFFARQDYISGEYSPWKIYSKILSTGLELLLTDALFFPSPDFQEPYPCPIGSSQMALIGSVSGSTRDLYATSLPVLNPYSWKIASGSEFSMPLFFVPSSPSMQLVILSEGRIYLIKEDGTSSILLSSTGNSSPSFDPSGRRGLFANNSIYTINIDGSGLFQHESDPTALFPTFSPDGRWIAYIKEDDIYCCLADQTISPVRLTVSPDLKKEDLLFSSDGSALYFTGIEKSARHIYRLSLSMTDTWPFLCIPLGVPVDLTPTSSDNYHLRVSPDSSLLIFVSTRNFLPELWQMSPTGANQKKLSLPATTSYLSHPAFSPYSSKEIAFLSGTPQKLWKSNITSPSSETAPVFPEITATQFALGKSPSGQIYADRFSVFQKIDSSLTLRYQLFFKVDAVPAPLSAMLVETVPPNWTLTSVTINGITPSSLTSNGQNSGTLKWLFGTSGIAPLQDTVLSLTFSISSATIGDHYLLSGWTETSTERTITAGDSSFLIQDPFCPADTDEDGKISDNEILTAIHTWASNSQFHGWPLLEEWDVWLLKLIAFWTADAYTYDPTASGIADYPRWRPL